MRLIDIVKVSRHLVTFTEEILNEKLHFLCSVRRWIFTHLQNFYAHGNLQFQNFASWEKFFFLKSVESGVAILPIDPNGILAGIYLLKVKRRSGVFIVNFEHISHLALVFLLLTLNMQLPAV